MNIDINKDSLLESAKHLERLEAEWRDISLEIEKETAAGCDDRCSLSGCAGIIGLYADLLKEIAENYESTEKKISLLSGE